MSNVKTRPFHTAPSQFRPWTSVDDNKLRKMVIEGRNSEEIAETLGRTRAAVMGRKSHLGIKHKMAPARGSRMPYTGFSKEGRSKTNDTTPQPIGKLEITPHFEKPAKRTLGNDIDNLIHQAKNMGLKLKIEISTED
jgi:hypothetical protein